MNKYTELSDFEINKKVARNMLPAEYHFNEKNEQVELIKFIGDTNKYEVYGSFDPCNNPTDAMPIIIENEISMIKSSCGWMCCHGSVGHVYHESLYRGAMELFLMMKDAENEKV